ncbi:hypothetical protein MUK42_37194 [Musa troglodytarum]|uniref:Uncharacterized protein n=1 Tax=Musa troglodytarum TaxID=320322 RepID=A0A9E7H6H3_9LILI|nr:hypothetical protein MUK42_37194 [Musa troglodytarum]
MSQAAASALHPAPTGNVDGRGGLLVRIQRPCWYAGHNGLTHSRSFSRCGHRGQGWIDSVQSPTLQAFAKRCCQAEWPMYLWYLVNARDKRTGVVCCQLF